MTYGRTTALGSKQEICMRWFSFLLSLSVGISVVVERDAEVNHLGRL